MRARARGNGPRKGVDVRAIWEGCNGSWKGVDVWARGVLTVGVLEGVNVWGGMGIWGEG